MPSMLRRAATGPWVDRVSWTWWEAGAVVGGAFLLADLVRDRALGASSTVTARFVGQILVETAWLAIVVAWLLVRRHPWRGLLGWTLRARSEAIDAGVFGAVLNGLVVVVVILPLRAILPEGSEAVAAASRDVTGMALHAAVAVLAFALVVAPVVEEFVFRGVLYRGVRDGHGTAAGAAVSAIAFGAIHWVPFAEPAGTVMAASTAAMGVGLAILYERRRTLLAPVVAHAAFNAVGLLASLR